MKRKYLGTLTFAAIALILIAASFLIGRAITPARTASAQNDPPNVPQAVDGLSNTTCTIDQFGILVDRMHIRCTAAPAADPTVFFFVYPSDSAHALTFNRFLVMTNTAYTLGKTILITYDNNSAHNYPSCLATDCRNIVQLFLNNP